MRILIIPCTLGLIAVVLGILPLGIKHVHGAAIVGRSTAVDQMLPITKAASGEAVKSRYRRPATIPFPASNPYTVEKVILGKKLFFDTRLSRSKLLSCATCHNPAFGWSDGQKTAVGNDMKQLKRRSPVIKNVAWTKIFMWDGRFRTLEEQALGPITSPDEMNMDVGLLVEQLTAIQGYRVLFDAAFPGEGVTPENVAKALATYERTIVSRRAPFDRWIEGDEAAISNSAKRGFDIFNSKARCAECHKGWTFTDDSFHDIGLPSKDLGRGKFFPQIRKMKYAFKTSGLRGLNQRGPFMHDGSLATMEDVIKHYDEGGIDRPSRSDLMRPLKLTKQEKSDLLAFLKTASSNQEFERLPILPN